MPPYSDNFEREPYDYTVEIEQIRPLGALTHAAKVAEIRDNLTRIMQSLPAGLHVHHGRDEQEAVGKALDEADRVMREEASRVDASVAQYQRDLDRIFDDMERRAAQASEQQSSSEFAAALMAIAEQRGVSLDAMARDLRAATNALKRLARKANMSEPEATTWAVDVVRTVVVRSRGGNQS